MAKWGAGEEQDLGSLTVKVPKKDHTVGEEDRLHQKLKNNERNKKTDKGVFPLLFYLQGSTRIGGGQGVRNKKMDFGWRDALFALKQLKQPFHW